MGKSRVRGGRSRPKEVRKARLIERYNEELKKLQEGPGGTFEAIMALGREYQKRLEDIEKEE